MVLRVIVFLTAASLVCGGSSPLGGDYFSTSGSSSSKISIDVAEDARLDVPGLLTKYGYPNEVHEVQTEDGYQLTVHRIPRGKGQDARQDRPVVFLMHGLFCSSADWILMGPQSGFAYLLADEGFDVWMGNARGNTYSRKHATLDPDQDSAFWKFSWNEIGYYDLPAMIDYVLAQTGKTQLHYAGHSQGTTSFFVMCALRKEYNAKIKLMSALAPVAYMSNLESPLVKYLAPIANTAELLTSLIGINELLPSTELMTLAGELLCKDNSLMQPVCTNILFLFCGANPELFNTTMLPIIMGHTPAGASSRQAVHYGQEFMSAMFRKYDYGPIINLIEYKRPTPPDYELKGVTAPVAVYYSDNDYLAHPTDVAQLYAELASPAGKFRVPHPLFNHLDYLWAIDVRTLLYDGVIELMKEYV